MTKRRGRAPTVSLSFLVRDLEYLRKEGDLLLATPLSRHSAPDDGGFRDGPVHRRLAVVDLDTETRSLRPPARFRRQGIGKTVSCYEDGLDRKSYDYEPEHFETDRFLQVSPFATVLKMLHFFEGPEILGREISWAFPSRQLLIVPRAGEMRNAFYERDSGSLQFFHHRAEDGHTIHTALSHDIVAHEATHAILDAIAPDLYDAVTPESLAMHEAIADLSAITQTLTNEMVIFSLDAISGSAIDPLDVLSHIAEEFGSDTRMSEGASFLRRLRNRRTLDPADDSLDEFGRPNRPEPTDPHALSQVLSGAIYAVYEARLKATRRSDRYGGIEKTFCPAARRVSRIVFRALDYMPPGEASFADYGRAFLAAAAATYKRPQKEILWLGEEFVRRGVVQSSAELASSPPDARLDAASLRNLIDDRDAAQRFAEGHRELLGIPRGRKFQVLPRAVASRSFGSKRTKDRKPELVFRLRWEAREDHDLGGRFPTKWAVAQGTTLVVDLDTGKILSVLTTDASARQHEARGALLRRWANEGRLLPQAESVGPDGKPLAEAVIVRTGRGVARAEGSGKTLHLASEAP